MRSKIHQNHNNAYPYASHNLQQQQQRAGDWKCVVCFNVNFSFRN